MFFLTNKEGERIEFDKGIIPLHSNVSSPNFNHITETTDLGQTIVLERQPQARTINVEFLLDADDFNDTYLLRNALYDALAREEEIYFHESAVPYLRWRVIVDNSVVGTKGYSHSHYSMTFTAIHGFSESIATTLNKHKFDEDVWQFGMGLEFEPQDYITEEKFFEIENMGNVLICPRLVPFEIKFIGASRNLRIINHTTGQEWSYKGSTSANDTLIINGHSTTVNGKNIFFDTNKQLIALKAGYNEFEIRGATGDCITSFNHKFYYY